MSTLRSFVSQSLDLSVPTLSAHSVVDLAPALQSLGIRTAFSSEVTRREHSTAILRPISRG